MEASSLDNILSSPSPETNSPTEDDSEGNSSAASNNAFTFPGSADENDNEVQQFKKLLSNGNVVMVANGIIMNIKDIGKRASLNIISWPNQYASSKTKLSRETYVSINL